LSIADLRSVVDDPDHFCNACFSGEYPIPMASGLNKSVFEDTAVA
jgi:glutamine phosphoribosylpyrophosphate amidotransferase